MIQISKPNIIIFCSVIIVISAGILYIQDSLNTYKNSPELQQVAEEFVINKEKPSPTNVFTQDGCSLFPNQLPGHDFRKACLTHDIAYWAGGSESERLAADIAFKETISHTGPVGPIFSHVMYSGVRVFGNSWLAKMTNANWGYGWNK